MNCKGVCFNVIVGAIIWYHLVIVDKIAVSFQESKKYFKAKKVVFTGCPLRQEIIDITEQSYVLRQITSPDITEVLEEDIISEKDLGGEALDLEDGIISEKSLDEVILDYLAVEDSGSDDWKMW